MIKVASGTRSSGLVSHVIFVEVHRDGAISVGFETCDLGTLGPPPYLGRLQERRSGPAPPATAVHDRRIHHKASPAVLTSELRRGVLAGRLDPCPQPPYHLA